MKTCKTCNKLETLDNFYKKASCSDGLSGTCKNCSRLAYKQWSAENRDRLRVYREKWRNANIDHVRKEARKWTENNREARYSHSSKWEKANPGMRNASKAIIRAGRAVPPWAEIEDIRKFYIDCPKGMAVDHIVPLNGETISGLHVLANLQYLTPSENAKKGNRYVAI